MISIYESQFLCVYCCILALIIGAVMGSFLNCAAYRIAHKQSFLKGRSHCPNCGHVLGAIDLIPIIGWMCGKGKCRYCKNPISIRYPLTELFFAGMTLLCLLRFDLSVVCARNWIFGCVLFTLALVDLETMIIPDTCHVLSILLWIITLPWTGYGKTEILFHVAAAFVYGGGILLLSLVMDKVLGRDSMGGGDIKLFFVMGLYLGFVASILAVFIACILGLIFATIGKREEGENAFPFGPSIAMATWIVLLYGEPFVNWYLGLLG